MKRVPESKAWPPGWEWAEGLRLREEWQCSGGLGGTPRLLVQPADAAPPAPLPLPQGLEWVSGLLEAKDTMTRLGWSVSPLEHGFRTYARDDSAAKRETFWQFKAVWLHGSSLPSRGLVRPGHWVWAERTAKAHPLPKGVMGRPPKTLQSLLKLPVWRGATVVVQWLIRRPLNKEWLQKCGPLQPLRAYTLTHPSGAVLRLRPGAVVDEVDAEQDEVAAEAMVGRVRWSTSGLVWVFEDLQEEMLGGFGWGECKLCGEDTEKLDAAGNKRAKFCGRRGCKELEQLLTQEGLL